MSDEPIIAEITGKKLRQINKTTLLKSGDWIYNKYGQALWQVLATCEAGAVIEYWVDKRQEGWAWAKLVEYYIPWVSQAPGGSKPEKPSNDFMSILADRDMWRDRVKDVEETLADARKLNVEYRDQVSSLQWKIDAAEAKAAEQGKRAVELFDEGVKMQKRIAELEAQYRKLESDYNGMGHLLTAERAAHLETRKALVARHDSLPCLRYKLTLDAARAAVEQAQKGAE